VARFFVTITVESWDLLRDLQRVHDLDVFGQTARTLPDERFAIDGLVGEAEVERLRGLGYEVEVGEDAEEVARRRVLGADGPS
jgi:hypothetical protein